MTSMTKKETDARRVAVIGAGAAGMMAAITAAESGAEVTLFERNDRVGKKLRITGKGRCNVTNNCDNNEFLSNVPTNPRFLYASLSRFSTADTMNFFESAGVPLKTERGKRVFPASGIQGVTVCQKRFPAQFLHDIRHGLRIVRSQERQVPQLSEVHLDCGEFSFTRNVCNPGTPAKLLQLRGQADILGCPEIGKEYFCFLHLSFPPEWSASYGRLSIQLTSAGKNGRVAGYIISYCTRDFNELDNIGLPFIFAASAGG